MRSLLAPGSGGGDPSSSGRQPPEQRPGGRRSRLAGERLRRALSLLGLLRSPVTLRRFATIGFMFVVGSLLSLASSRGRCAGPQEVSRGLEGLGWWVMQAGRPVCCGASCRFRLPYVCAAPPGQLGLLASCAAS